MKISKEIKVGLIALLAIVSFIILFQFMKGKSIFSTNNSYYIKYDSVEGLAKSSPVSINGLKVGQVTEIKPMPQSDGHIYFVVKISINNDFVFSKNSIVEILEPGFMSAKEARIILAYEQPYAKNGDTLRGAFQKSIMKSLSSDVGPVKDRLSSVLQRFDSLVASTNKLVDDENRREIKFLLRNLNSTLASFRLISEQTSKLLLSSQVRLNNVLDNANKTMVTASNTADKYGRVADSINIKQLNEALDKVSEMSDHLNKLVLDIESGKGSLGRFTKDEELYNNLNQSAASLHSLMEDFKKNPKRYINISVFGKSTK